MSISVKARIGLKFELDKIWNDVRLINPNHLTGWKWVNWGSYLRPVKGRPTRLRLENKLQRYYRIWGRGKK